MRKLATRFVFGLWIVGAPFILLGCAEEPKPATPAATPPAAAPGADKGAPAGDAKK